MKHLLSNRFLNGILYDKLLILHILFIDLEYYFIQKYVNQLNKID